MANDKKTARENAPLAANGNVVRYHKRYALL